MCESMKQKMAEWLADFSAITHRCVVGHEWTTLINHLAMMGVESERSCCCLHDKDEEEAYFHSKHRTYNREVWRIINSAELHDGGVWTALRTTLHRDMKVDEPGMPGFGKIVSHEYAGALLANFVRHDPSEEWVGEL